MTKPTIEQLIETVRDVKGYVGCEPAEMAYAFDRGVRSQAALAEALKEAVKELAGCKEDWGRGSLHPRHTEAIQKIRTILESAANGLEGATK